MSRFVKQLGAALMGITLLAPAAQAQLYRPGSGFRGPYPSGATYIPQALANRLNYQRLAVRNFATNTAILGRGYSNVPPWVFGYNPYPPVNVGPAALSSAAPFGSSYVSPSFGGYASYPGVYGGGYAGYPGAYGGGYGLANPYGFSGYSAGFGNASYGSGYGGNGGYSAGYNPY